MSHQNGSPPPFEAAEGVRGPLGWRAGDFRLRGREISRVEGLSDAVFGFAITLLIVSLEVPRTSGEMLHAMRGFVSFAFTFFILFSLWRTQFTFFRRFGLEDKVTVALNGALLFVVLFFIYPLKFILGSMIDRIIGRLFGLETRVELPNGTFVPAIAPADAAPLWMIYGLGFAAVFGVFALLYRHAYRMRDALGLNEVETFDTRSTMWQMTMSAGVGLFTALAQAFKLLPSNIPHRAELMSVGSTVIAVVDIGLVAAVVRFRRSRKPVRAALLKAAGAAASELGAAGAPSATSPRPPTPTTSVPRTT